MALWFLGQEDGVTLQGQAGKPFYHQKGPKLKFPDDPDTIVDNSCYCEYPYMRYFWIYAKVDEANCQFMKKDWPEKALNQAWYPDYTVDENTGGYAWQILGGYEYAGCMAHTDAVGKWQTVSLFPYDQQCDDDAQYQQTQNLTFPSVSYLGSKSSDPPFQTDTGPASLMRMLVCSYKCCNGARGCGTQTNDGGDGGDGWNCPVGGQFCQAWFPVYWNYEDLQRVGNYAVVGQPYNATCGQCYQSDKTVIASCTAAYIRRHGERMKLQDTQLQSCATCLQRLRKDIYRNEAPPPVSCAIFRLYEYPQDGQTCTFMDPVLIQTPQQWATIPAEVAKGGQGCRLTQGHPTGNMLICRPGDVGGVRGFTWVYQPGCTQQPEPPFTGLTGQSTIGLECTCQELSKEEEVDQSQHAENNGRDSTKDPCNEPDPPPYQYRQFKYNLFDVYKLKLISGGSGYPQEDDCVSHYEYQQDAQGNPNWRLEKSGLKDFQIKNSTLFVKLQNRIDADEGYYYRVVRSGCKPEIDESDKSSLDQGLIANPESQCNVYFMVTWFPDTHCSEQNLAEPASSGECTVWKRLGQMSKAMLAERNMFVGIWTPIIQQRDGDILVGYRYIVETDPGTHSYCQDPPDPPGYQNFVRLHYIIREWDQKCEQGCPGEVLPPDSYKLQQLAATAQSYPDDTSGQVQDSVPCRVGGGLSFDPVGPEDGQDPNFHPALYANPILQAGMYAQVLTCQDGYQYQVLGKAEDGTIINNTISCQPTLAVVQAHNVFRAADDLYFFLQGTGAPSPVVFSQAEVSEVTHHGIRYPAIWHVLPSQSQLRQQYKDVKIQYAYAAACCGAQSYYVTTEQDLQGDLYALQGGACFECQEDKTIYSKFGYVGMGFTGAMQQYLGTDKWIYKAAAGQGMADSFHYMIAIGAEGEDCDKLKEEPVQNPPDIILLSYKVASWQPDCEKFEGNSPVTKTPEGFKGEVVTQSISPMNFYQARLMLAATGSENGFFLQNGSHQWELNSPWPLKGAVYAFGNQGGGSSYQYIAGGADGIYQMPQDMCQAVYIQPILKCFSNPNPSVFHIDGGTLYWSGTSSRRFLPSGAEIQVPHFYALSSDVEEQIDEEFQVDGECEGQLIYFSVHFIPKKKQLPGAKALNIKFDIFCCDAHYYYAYVLKYDSSSCSFKMPSSTPALSGNCSTQWTSLGIMRQGAFYQKYYGKEGWIPFGSETFGDSASVVWIAESDEPPEQFCQTAPSLSGASAPYVVYYQVSGWEAECKSSTNEVEVTWPDLEANKSTYALVGSNKTASRAYLYYFGLGSVTAPTEATFLGSSKQLSTCPAQLAAPVPSSGLYTVTLADKTKNCAGTEKTTWALVPLDCKSAVADPTSCKIYAFRTSIAVPGSNAKSIFNGQLYSVGNKVTVVKFGNVDSITYEDQQEEVNGYIVKYTVMTVPSAVKLTEFLSCSVSFPQACVDIQEFRGIHRVKPCNSYDTSASSYGVTVVRDGVGNICSKIPSGFYTTQSPSYDSSTQSYSKSLVPVVNGKVTPSSCSTIYYIQSLGFGCGNPSKPSLLTYSNIDWSNCKYVTYFYIRVAHCNQLPSSCTYSQGSQYTLDQWASYGHSTSGGFWGESVLSQELKVSNNVVQAQDVSSAIYYMYPVIGCKGADTSPKAPTGCPSGVTINWGTSCQKITVYYIKFSECTNPTSSCTFTKGSTYAYTQLTATSWWSTSTSLTGTKLTVSNNVVQPGTAKTVYYVVAVVHNSTVTPKAPTGCPSGVTINWGTRYVVYATKVAKCDQPSASCTFSLVTSTATSVTASSWWSASRSATGTALNTIGGVIGGDTSMLGCIAASSVSGPVYYLVAKKYNCADGVPSNWAGCPSASCIYWGNNCEDTGDDDSDAVETPGCAENFCNKCSLSSVTATLSSFRYTCESKTDTGCTQSWKSTNWKQTGTSTYYGTLYFTGTYTYTYIQGNSCPNPGSTTAQQGPEAVLGISAISCSSGKVVVRGSSIMITGYQVPSFQTTLTCNQSGSTLTASGSFSVSDTYSPYSGYTESVSYSGRITLVCSI